MTNDVHKQSLVSSVSLKITKKVFYFACDLLDKRESRPKQRILNLLLVRSNVLTLLPAGEGNLTPPPPVLLA